MSFTSKKTGRLLCLLLFICVLFCACTRKETFAVPYGLSQESRGLDGDDITSFFSENLCVAGDDVNNTDGLFSDKEAAALFDLTRGEVVYAHRMHARMDPASMTKILTALVAVETAPLDTVLTCKDKDYVTEKGAQLLDMETGEQMTLEQALNYLLVFSANDVAVMIADNLCSSVDEFVAKMNEKAAALGATASRFENPHGLTDSGQYVTAYDMYLLLQAAMAHPELREIVNRSSYNTTYYKNDGTTKDAEVFTTNAYVRENGSIRAPEGIRVIGGKTGSTHAAGECIALLAENELGEPYIAVVMHAADSNTLYRKMSALLRYALPAS